MDSKPQLQQVNTPAKAASFVRQLEPARTASIVALLLDDQCRLLDFVLMTEDEDNGRFDARPLLRAAEIIGAKGYVLVTPSCRLIIPERLNEVSRIAALLRELDIHFLDFVHPSGSTIRALPRRDPSARKLRGTPWDAWLE